MIFFVGDKPSRKNKNPKIPFVGTKSYTRLLQWIDAMDISVTDVVLCNTENIDRLGQVNVPGLLTCVEHGDHVIALGKAAEKHLTNLKIAHFPMPHPSGLNRQNNNKDFIKKKLKECKKWLNY